MLHFDMKEQGLATDQKSVKYREPRCLMEVDEAI